MPKVKVIEWYGQSYEHGDYDYSYLYSPQDATDWDNISDEELNALKCWVKIQNSFYNTTKKYAVVTETDINIPKTVNEYLKKIEEENRLKEEKEREKQEKALEAAAKKIKKEKKKELELLKKLQQKYPKEASV